MLKHSQEELKKILVEEFGYSPKSASLSAKDLMSVGPDLQDAFERYRKDKTISTIEVEGFTISNLIQNHLMKFPGAILLLDWLRREPEEAKKAIEEGIE